MELCARVIFERYFSIKMYKLNDTKNKLYGQFPTDTYFSRLINMDRSDFQNYLLENFQPCFMFDLNITFNSLESCKKAVEWLNSMVILQELSLY